MRIVVTGGSGKIGRVVVKHLADRGHTLLNLDIARPPPDAPGRYMHTDLAHRDVLEPRLVDFGCEAVCHLGELANVGRDLEERVYLRNAATTASLLISAADAGVTRIAYASSVQVYGQFGVSRWLGVEGTPLAPLNMPVDESEPPRPWNGYGAQKAGAELFLASLCRRRGLHGVALRLPWVAQPDDGRWWKRDGNTGVDGRRRKVQELGAWLGVQDAATAFEAAVTWEGESPWSSEGPAGSFEAFHLAADDSRSSGEAEAPIRERLLEDWPHFPALPEDWPATRCPLSSDRFRHATGWRPTVTVASMLADAPDQRR